MTDNLILLYLITFDLRTKDQSIYFRFPLILISELMLSCCDSHIKISENNYIYPRDVGLPKYHIRLIKTSNTSNESFRCICFYFFIVKPGVIRCGLFFLVKVYLTKTQIIMFHACVNNCVLISFILNMWLHFFLDPVYIFNLNVFLLKIYVLYLK